MKTFKILILLLVLLILILPFFSLAKIRTYQSDGKTVKYEGLVPCGKKQAGSGESRGVTEPCTFCHIFVMIKGIFDFILIDLVPIIAILIIIFAGILFYFGGVNPQLALKGKDLLVKTIIALVVIYGAYFFVGVVLNLFQVADWTGLKEWANQGAFSIKCSFR